MRFTEQVLRNESLNMPYGNDTMSKRIDDSCTHPYTILSVIIISNFPRTLNTKGRLFKRILNLNQCLTIFSNNLEERFRLRFSQRPKVSRIHQLLKIHWHQPCHGLSFRRFFVFKT